MDTMALLKKNTSNRSYIIRFSSTMMQGTVIYRCTSTTGDAAVTCIRPSFTPRYINIQYRPNTADGDLGTGRTTRFGHQCKLLAKIEPCQGHEQSFAGVGATSPEVNRSRDDSGREEDSIKF